VRLRSSASPNSDTLAFMGLDSATNKWGSPTGIFIGGELISGVTGNPVMIQGNRYVVGNYELLVPRGQSIVHYARFNDPGYDQFRWGWQSEVFFGGGSAGGGAGVGLVGRTPTGVSFLQSNFRDGDMNGKLDAVVRLSSSTSPSGDTLAFMGLDSATNTWSNPTDIVVGGQPISGVTGDPVMVQANWGGVGNYELLVPQGQRLVHYARLNDPGPDQFRWIHVREVFFGGASAGGSAGIGLVARTPIAVSLLQSNYRGDGIHGNLDAVVRLSSAASPSGDTLAFMGLDSATNTWGKPTEILVGGQPISGVTGF